MSISGADKLNEYRVGVAPSSPYYMLVSRLKSCGLQLMLVLGVLLCASVAIGWYFDEPLTALKDNYLITPIAFIAATVANATAVGGGFLFFPLFVFVYGLAPIGALKLSLATQAFGMSSGALGWSKAFIDAKGFLFGALGSIVGLYLGTFIWQIPSEQIKPFFGWLSLIIFFVILLEVKLGGAAQNNRIENTSKSLLGGLFFTALAGGLVTAWAAIGVGEFVALYLLFVYRTKFSVSVATGVAVLAVTSVVALVFHAFIGGIPWGYLIFTVPGVVLGGLAGAWLGKNITVLIGNMRRSSRGDLSVTCESSSPLKLIFSAVVLVDGVFILVNHYVL